MQPNKHAEISAASWSQVFIVWIKTAMDTCQSGKFRILDFFFFRTCFCSFSYVYCYAPKYNSKFLVCEKRLINNNLKAP